MTRAKKQKRMKKIVAALQLYVATYTEQDSYEDYSDRCYIEDILYGLGLSLNHRDHYGASGFDRFKAVLREHIQSDSNGDSSAKRQD